MAKNKKSKKGKGPSAPRREDPSGNESGADDAARNEPLGPTGEIAAMGQSAVLRPATSAGGLFHIYKSGQGYFTRLFTGIAAGLIALGAANELHDMLPEDPALLKMGVPAGLVVILGLIAFWVVGSNRKSNDFFIATEGEMKKVSWSTRAEVIGSTKVVIVFTIFMATVLCVVDFGFLAFFSAIDVIRVNLGDLFGL